MCKNSVALQRPEGKHDAPHFERPCETTRKPLSRRATVTPDAKASDATDKVLEHEISVKALRRS